MKGGMGTVKSRDEIKKELASNAFAEKGGVVLFYGASGISRDMSKVLNPGEDIVSFQHAFRNSIWGYIKSFRMFRDYVVCTNQRFIYIERGQMAFSWLPFFKKTVSIPYNEVLNVTTDKRIGIFSGKLRLESTKKKMKLAMSNRKSAEELKHFLMGNKVTPCI